MAAISTMFPPSLVASGTISPVSVVAVDKKGQVPVTYAWSFDIQRELGRQTSLDIGYVGNMGRHQQYNRDLGQLPLNTTTAGNHDSYQCQHYPERHPALPRVHQRELHRVRRHQQLQRIADAPDAAVCHPPDHERGFRVVQSNGRG